MDFLELYYLGLEEEAKRNPYDIDKWREYYRVRQKIFERESEEAHKAANSSFLGGLLRTSAASAVENAPVIASLAGYPHIGLLGALLNAGTGVLSSVSSRIRGAEEGDGGPEGWQSAKNLALTALLYSGSPLAKVAGLGLSGKYWYDKYSQTKDELENVGGSSDPISTLVYSTVGPAVPGYLSGGDPFGAFFDYGQLASIRSKTQPISSYVKDESLQKVSGSSGSALDGATISKSNQLSTGEDAAKFKPPSFLEKISDVFAPVSSIIENDIIKSPIEEVAIKREDQEGNINTTVVKKGDVLKSFKEADNVSNLYKIAMNDAKNSTQWGLYRRVVMDPDLPEDHPFKKDGHSLLGLATSLAKKYDSIDEVAEGIKSVYPGLSEVESKAVASLGLYANKLKRLADVTGRRYKYEVAKTLEFYFKQMPKPLEKLLGGEINLSEQERRIIADYVIRGIDDAPEVVKKHKSLVESLIKLRNEMVKDLFPKYRAHEKDLNVSLQAANLGVRAYVDNYIEYSLKGYRDFSVNEDTLREVIFSFTKPRVFSELGPYQETDLAKLAGRIEAEHVRFSDFPKLNWVYDVLIKNREKGQFLSDRARKLILNEVINFYKRQPLLADEDNNFVRIANEWLGWNVRNTTEAVEKLVGHVVSNVITTPKFLLFTNFFDPLQRIAQVSSSWDEVKLGYNIFKEYLTHKIVASNKPARYPKMLEEADYALRKLGHDIGGKYFSDIVEYHKNIWDYDVDKGKVADFLKKILGREWYNRVGSYLSKLPTLIEKQEVHNNVVLYLFELEKVLRNKYKISDPNILAIETLSKEQIRSVRGEAINNALRIQGKLKGLFSKSSLVSTVFSGNVYGRGSGEYLAYLLMKPFVHYPTTVFVNVFNTMKKIYESGNVNKIALLQPVILLAASGIISGGVPKFVELVAKDEENPAIRAMVAGMLKEITPPTTLFVLSQMSGVSRVVSGVLTGDINQATSTLYKTVRPYIPNLPAAENLYHTLLFAKNLLK